MFGSVTQRKEITATIENELRAIKKLCDPGGHRNIVSVLREGTVKDAALYYIDMELCNYNLEEFMQNHGPLSDQRLSMEQVWEIMVQIASGLTFIHAQGEVHRDLKPRNGIPFHYSLMCQSYTPVKRPSGRLRISD